MYEEAEVERIGKQPTAYMFGIICENTKRKGPV